MVGDVRGCTEFGTYHMCRGVFWMWERGVQLCLFGTVTTPAQMSEMRQKKGEKR